MIHMQLIQFNKNRPLKYFSSFELFQFLTGLRTFFSKKDAIKVNYFAYVRLTL